MLGAGSIASIASGALILLVGCVYGISHYQRKSSGKAQAKISPPEDVKGMSSVVPA
jgi:hypothetical protein